MAIMGTAGGSASSGASSSGDSGGDSGGSDSADTGAADTASDAADSTGDDAGGDGAEASSAASDVPKFKFRRGGRDYEHPPEELAKMLDDDYEHDFHGAGGKPLMVDGKPVKMRWRDIVRAVQMSNGATDAMRQHNEARQRVEGVFEWGKQPENLPVFFEDHMGVENYEDWVLERAKEIVNREEQLVELAQKDPYKHQAELRKQAEERFARRQQAKDRHAQGEARKQQRAGQMEQHWSKVGTTLSAVGLQLNDRTRSIADKICREFAEAKAELGYEQLAEYVRDAYHDEIFGYLDGHDDEKLLGLLGNSRRERLRKAELAALKGKKATEKKAEPKPAARADSNGGRDRDRGMTADEFLRKGRNGGRV